MKTIKSANQIIRKTFSTSLLFVVMVSLCFFPIAPVQAIENGDFTAVPPFLATEVKPNVLFIIDNSNSMDEDVDGAAVGSDSAISRSEIARKAIIQIMNENQDTMRFGLMAYDQSGISGMQIHNSFYYSDFDPNHWDPNGVPTPKDPATNTKRFPSPITADEFIYYDTALPFYSSKNEGTSFCYSYDFTYDDPGTCRKDDTSSCHNYWCFDQKTGTLATPIGVTRTVLASTYGYSGYSGHFKFYATDSDIAVGFHEFGLEMSWIHRGDTWFANSSPGGGILHTDITDSSDTHLAELRAKLATSQFVTAIDTPLRNAGLTPIAGTINSALAYFKAQTVTTATGVTATNPITLDCQKNYIILVTDGLPSVDSFGITDDAANLLPEVRASITALRSITNPDFSNTFDVKTYVVGFALPAGSGSQLDALAIAGGTAENGKALLANDATQLAAKLKKIFRSINKKISSGAATSVISNTRSGEGVIYQSIFYPEYSDSNNNSVSWVGNVYSLFVDAFGNIREDTNQNQMLDIYPDDDAQFQFDSDLADWYNNGQFDTEDADGDGHLDVDEDQVDHNIPGWMGNGQLDNEDVDGDGFVDIDEDFQFNPDDFPLYSDDWYVNGVLDDEDEDNDGKLDIDEDQVDYGIPAWLGNRATNPNPDTEDADGDGRFETSNEDAQLILGHEDWQDNLVLDSEDIDGDGRLDVDEDLVDYGIPAWLGNRGTNPNPDSEDIDGDGHLDVDEDLINHGIPAWIGNRATNPNPDTEDKDGDNFLDEINEDVDNDGHLDVIEDKDGDGLLDTVNEDLQNIAGHGLWRNNGQLNTEDVNGNGVFDTYDEDEIPNASYTTWLGNDSWDSEDTNNNGVFDTTNEDLEDHGYGAAWEGNGILDTEDVDGDGVFDRVNEDQIDYGITGWMNNDQIDAEDVDSDGFCDIIEDDQVIAGHGLWRNNGVLDTEDSNGNGSLDPGEDTNGNGSLDTEDFDNDGVLSTNKEDINSNGSCDTEDINGDGNLDIDEDVNNNNQFDYEDLNNNNILDVSEDLDNDNFFDTEDKNGNGIFDRTEDTNDNGLLDTEDIDLDGHLDVNEDVDGDGRLDTVNEDLDNDGRLDVGDEDLNGNHLLDTEDLDGDTRLDVKEDLNANNALDDEDIDNDGRLDVAEDTNGNGILDKEDLDGDGHLDPNEDLNLNGVLDTEDIDGDGVLDVNEDRNGDGIIDTEDYDGDGKLDYAEDINNNGIVDTEDLDNDGTLDSNEDTNGNGILDYEIDHNGNGVFDATDNFVVYAHSASGVVAYIYADTNGNGRLERNEDLNGNGVLDYDLSEDTSPANGELDPGEDLNGNNMLDLSVDEDQNGNGLLDVHEDTNNNGRLDAGEDLNGDGKLYVEDELVDTVSLRDIAYIWDATSWLNEITDADIIKQRVYNLNDERRYLFTFVDHDRDKVTDAGEQIAFVTDDPDQPDNYDKLAESLVELVHRSDEPAYVEDIRADGNYNHYRVQQTKRTINFIRGKDQAEYTSSTTTPYTLEAMRSRATDYDEDNTVETWRLGDIIHSSPTVVGRPAERYHLLYDDPIYARFADKYEKRRSMIYVGGNDGMIHAFNGGFFDSETLAVKLHSTGIAEYYNDANNNGQYDTGETFYDFDGDNIYDDGAGTETQYPLGSEIWAYLPYNLQPHLRWLTEQSYEHVYYNDLKAKIVDAQIFTEEAACKTNVYSDTCIHPDGWGTLMISGMRFGGSEFPKVATWDFDSDSNGWAFKDDSVSQTFASGAWTIETTHGIGNPFILSPPNLEIDPSKIKSVEIRFLTTAIDAGTGGARLLWDSVGNSQFNEGSQKITAPSVDTSGEYYVYTFDLSDNDKWWKEGDDASRIIKQIRIDPQGAFTTGSSVSIDYVNLGDGRGYVSSYVLMDITNPETPPSVLAEINLLGLGYTTSMPTVIPLKSETDSSKNDWYMAFGSGPNHNSLADHTTLTNAESNMPGNVFVLSLSDLISQQKVRMLDSSGFLSDGFRAFSTFDSDTYVSDLITVDFNRDYAADVVYFGTVSGNEAKGWGGKLRRLVLNNGSTTTSSWTPDNTLFTLANGANQSVTAMPSVAIDNLRNFWVYFGTGRYFTRDDINISASQNYFGIKEPLDSDKNFTWAEVPAADLLNTTDAVVYDDQRIENMGALDTWQKLIAEIDNNRSGWLIDLDITRERNLGQAALLGEIVTFTTYEPSADLCSTDGWSYGYGLYYKTGTAYYRSIFGFELNDSNGSGTADVKGEKKIDATFAIGKGMSLSPAIHSGREKGSTAYIQTSSGSIFKISEDNPGLTKSAKSSWGQIE